MMMGWYVPRIAFVMLILMWVFSEPAERFAVGLPLLLHYFLVIPLLHSIWLLFSFLMLRTINSWGNWLVSRKAHEESGRFTFATRNELRFALSLLKDRSI